MKFDHIGVVVPNLARGRNHLAGVFGIARWTREFIDPVIDVHVQFGVDGSGVCYELVAPLSAASPVARTLRTRDRILNHTAYLTADLEHAAAQLRKSRCVPIGKPNPAVAYCGHRVQFFTSPLAFVVELIEAPNHVHEYVIAESNIVNATLSVMASDSIRSNVA